MHRGGLDNYIDDMWDFFSENIASNMKKFQNISSTNNETILIDKLSTCSPTMNGFAEELLNQIEEMDIHKVSFV